MPNVKMGNNTNEVQRESYPVVSIKIVIQIPCIYALLLPD